MILYHGSIETIEQPKIMEQQRLLDFGKGFYLTSSLEQAERWALIKMKRSITEAKATVNCYLVADNLIHNPLLKIKLFSMANEEWLDFIVLNRSNETSHGYDIVTGPVANDNLYETLTLFETGILTKPETIARLKAHKLFDQYSFHTPEALACLKFAQAYHVNQ
jgi:glycosyltransferase involved in cell wall biosynthesis